MNPNGPERRKLPEQCQVEIRTLLNELEFSISLLSHKFDASHKAFRDFESEARLRNDKLDDLIHGNGRPGMKADVEALKLIPPEVRLLSERQRLSDIRQAFWTGGVIVLVFIIKFIFKI